MEPAWTEASPCRRRYQTEGFRSYGARRCRRDRLGCAWERGCGLVGGVTMRRALLALALSVVMTGAALAAPFEDGAAAYDRNDYATAARIWRPLAEQGNALSQMYLGVMYERGRGLAQDQAEAARWYRLAADQGLPVAQYALGGMYADGIGVPEDYVQAHLWLSLAASRLETSGVRDHAVRNRDRIAGLMTPAQVAEAQRLAREWDAAHPTPAPPR